MMLTDLSAFLQGGSVPLNLVIAAFVLGGVAAEAFCRRRSRIQWIVPAACLCVMAVTEAVWQLHPSEYLILFYVWGWFAEAALLGCALGAAVRLVVSRLLDR